MNRKLIAVVASGLLLALTAGSVAYAAIRRRPSFTAAMTTSPDRSGSSTPRPAVPRSAKRRGRAPGTRKPTGTGRTRAASIQAHTRRGWAARQMT